MSDAAPSPLPPERRKYFEGVDPTIPGAQPLLPPLDPREGRAFVPDPMFDPVTGPSPVDTTSVGQFPEYAVEQAKALPGKVTDFVRGMGRPVVNAYDTISGGLAPAQRQQIRDLDELVGKQPERIGFFTNYLDAQARETNDEQLKDIVRYMRDMQRLAPQVHGRRVTGIDLADLKRHPAVAEAWEKFFPELDVPSAPWSPSRPFGTRFERQKMLDVVMSTLGGTVALPVTAPLSGLEEAGIPAASAVGGAFDAAGEFVAESAGRLAAGPPMPGESMEAYEARRMKAGQAAEQEPLVRGPADVGVGMAVGMGARGLARRAGLVEGPLPANPRRSQGQMSSGRYAVPPAEQKLTGSILARGKELGPGSLSVDELGQLIRTTQKRVDALTDLQGLPRHVVTPENVRTMVESLRQAEATAAPPAAAPAAAPRLPSPGKAPPAAPAARGAPILPPPPSPVAQGPSAQQAPAPPMLRAERQLPPGDAMGEELLAKRMAEPVEDAPPDPGAEELLAKREAAERAEADAGQVTIESVLDEDGEVSPEKGEALDAIAKREGVGITRDRDAEAVAVDGTGKVVGGLYTSFDGDNYAFDVVVDKASQGKGIGSQLIDEGIRGFDDRLEMNPDATMRLDVTSRRSKAMLEKRGFEVIERVGAGRWIMERPADAGAEAEMPRNEGTIALPSSRARGGGYVNLPVQYIRFGDPPKDKSGRPIASRAYGADGKPFKSEPGVSVMPAWYDPKTKKFVIDGGIEIAEGVGDMTSGKGARPAYLVSGKEIGTGSDGEPALDPSSLKVVRTIDYDEIVTADERTITAAGRDLPKEEWPDWDSTPEADELVAKREREHAERNAPPSGRDFFTPEAIRSAESASGYKSREKLIEMAPGDFLKMAEKLPSPDPGKTATVSKALETTGAFDDVPFLRFEHDGAGNAVVVGHEGRHRAMALAQRGVESMPVRLISSGGKGGDIRWSEQGDAKAWDRVKGQWPQRLRGQTDGEIPFPVRDPLGPIQAAQVANPVKPQAPRTGGTKRLGKQAGALDVGAIVEPLQKAVANVKGRKGQAAKLRRAKFLEENLPTPPAEEPISSIAENRDPVAAAEDLRRKLERDPKIGQPENRKRVITIPTTGEKLIIGRRTPKDDADFLQTTGPKWTPELLRISREWYKKLLAAAQDAAEGSGMAPEQILTGWLLANQNVSPSGAMFNAIRAIEKQRGAQVSLKSGLTEDQLAEWFSGGMPSKGIGSKIHDFVDAALRKGFRTWMANHPAGEMPYVVDVHEMNHAGYISRTFRDQLAEAGVKGTEKLKIDHQGTPSPTQYEYQSARGNEIAAILNSVGFEGGGWEPAEVQAVRWVRQQIAMGLRAEHPEDLTKSTGFRLAAEIEPGAGAPLNAGFAEVYAALPKEVQSLLTEEVVSRVFDLAVKAASVLGSKQMGSGTGMWQAIQNAATVIGTLSTPRGAIRLATAIGYLLQQTEVWAFRRGKSVSAGLKELGFQSAIAVYFESPALKDPKNRTALAAALTKALPGMQPGLRPDQIVAISPEGWTDKRVAALQSAIEKAFESLDFEVDSSVVPINLYIARNNWTEVPDGASYLEAFRGAGGSEDGAQQLRRRFPRVDSSLRRAADRIPREPGTALDRWIEQLAAGRRARQGRVRGGVDPTELAAGAAELALRGARGLKNLSRRLRRKKTSAGRAMSRTPGARDIAGYAVGRPLELLETKMGDAGAELATQIRRTLVDSRALHNQYLMGMESILTKHLGRSWNSMIGSRAARERLSRLPDLIERDTNPLAKKRLDDAKYTPDKTDLALVEEFHKLNAQVAQTWNGAGGRVHDPSTVNAVLKAYRDKKLGPYYREVLADWNRRAGFDVMEGGTKTTRSGKQVERRGLIELTRRLDRVHARIGKMSEHRKTLRAEVKKQRKRVEQQKRGAKTTLAKAREALRRNEDAVRAATKARSRLASELARVRALTVRRPLNTHWKGFFPRQLTDEFMDQLRADGAAQAQAAADMARQGQVETAEEALGYITEYMNPGLRAHFAPLEVPRTIRFADSAYERDFVRVMTRYYRRAAMRTAEARHLHPSGRHFDRLLTEIRKTSGGGVGDSSAFKSLLLRILQRDPEMRSGAEGALERLAHFEGLMQANLKLINFTLAPLQLTQLRWPVSLHGWGPTMSALAEYISNPREAAERARSTGAVQYDDEMLQNITMEDDTTRKGALGKFTDQAFGLLGVRWADRFPRTIEVLAARGQLHVLRNMLNSENPRLRRRAANKLRSLYKLDADEIAELRQQGPIREGLLNKAATFAVKEVHFETRPEDRPWWAVGRAEPIYKMVMRLKNFPHAESRALVNHILLEIKRDPANGLRRLLRYLAAGVLVGELYGEVRDAITGWPREVTPWGEAISEGQWDRIAARIGDDLLMVGSLGVLGDVMSRQMRTGSGWKDVFIPVSVSTMQDLTNDLLKLVRAEDEEEAAEAAERLGTFRAAAWRRLKHRYLIETDPEYLQELLDDMTYESISSSGKPLMPGVRGGKVVDPGAAKPGNERKVEYFREKLNDLED